MLLWLSMVPTVWSSLSSYLRLLIGAPVLTLSAYSFMSYPNAFWKVFHEIRNSGFSSLLTIWIFHVAEISQSLSQFKIKDSKDSGSNQSSNLEVKKKWPFKGQEKDICPSFPSLSQKCFLSFHQLGTCFFIDRLWVCPSWVSCRLMSRSQSDPNFYVSKSTIHHE